MTDYAYDANDRMISESTGGVTVAYTYDRNGNLLSESGGKTYSYNILNQLISPFQTIPSVTAEPRQGL